MGVETIRALKLCDSQIEATDESSNS